MQFLVSIISMFAGLFSLVLFFGVPIVIIVVVWKKYSVKWNKRVEERNSIYGAVANTPSDFTVDNLIAYIKREGCWNEPQYWNQLRAVWLAVNESPNVSTEKKKQLKQFLMLKGLTMHHQDAQIIDNHNANFNNNMQEEINRQNMEWAMEESRKAVTPFDMGGYVQGDGFNPSDTMVADAQREQMNQMNDMTMNNMNMF